MTKAHGHRLRVAMQIRGISKLCAMAAAVNVSESAISRWCSGGTMTVANIITVCEVLNISADWLLLGRGQMDSQGVDTLTSHPEIGLALARMTPPARMHLERFLATI